MDASISIYIACILSLLAHSSARETFVQYSPESDNAVLWKYLHGIKN